MEHHRMGCTLERLCETLEERLERNEHRIPGGNNDDKRTPGGDSYKHRPGEEQVPEPALEQASESLAIADASPTVPRVAQCAWLAVLVALKKL